MTPKPGLPAEALAKATISNRPTERPKPPPPPAMPAALASGDVLDSRATEMDPERLRRMQAANPQMAAAAQQATSLARQAIKSPLNESSGAPLTDDDAIGNTPTHPDAMPTAAPAADKGTETVAQDPVKHICKYCGYDNDKPDVPDCESEDKVQFMAHLMGMSFTKEYSLMDGHLKVEFRKLTVQEIDACALHVMKQMKADILAPTQEEYMEAYGRCRLYLQMVRLSGKAVSGGEIVFPEGLSKETNPDAGTFYDRKPNAGEVSTTGDIDQPATLDDVTKHMLTGPIKNETVQRILLQALREFNRLVSYMETNAGNPSFWKGIQ